MPRPSTLRLAVAAALTAATASTASAQQRTWAIGTGSNGTCTAAAANAYYTCTSTTGGTLTVAGLSAAGSTANSLVTYGVLTNQGSNGVGVGSAGEGYGSASSGNGDHAVDNGNNNGLDLLYLGFAAPQALNGVTFGWTGYDADFQVLRWTGAGTPSVTATTTVGSLLGPNAWELLATVNGRTSTSGNDADVTYGFNTGNATSSHWLISAYNPGFGTASFAAGASDQFKVKGVAAANVPPAAVVPEPSTYALFAAGLAGLVGAARRRRAA